MKRIDGIGPGGEAGYYALKHDLPPAHERPSPHTAACIVRWIMHLPRQSAVWNNYVLAAVSLRDFPGVPPAYKQFPEATHEILIAALHPDHDDTALKVGGVHMLDPINYTIQRQLRNDQQAADLAEHLVVEFVNGCLLAEPEGVHGARELLIQSVEKFLKGRA